MDPYANHELPKVKAFLEDVLVLHSLSKSLSTLLFLLLFKHETNKPILINNYLKKEIAAITGFSKGSIDNALTKFVEVGLLTRLDRGTYEINPLLKEMDRLMKSGEGELRLRYMGEERKILGRETKRKENRK